MIRKIYDVLVYMLVMYMLIALVNWDMSWLPSNRYWAGFYVGVCSLTSINIMSRKDEN